MNPLFLLLGLFGAVGTTRIFGSSGSVQNSKNASIEVNQNNDDDDDREIITSDLPEPPVVEQEDETPVEQNEPPVAEQEDETPVEQNEPPAAENPTGPSNPTPTAPEQTGDGDPGGETTTVLATSNVDVIGGRVTTLSPGSENIVDIRIVSDLEYGNVTVNPDNTLAVVMTDSDFTGRQSFTYEMTNADGSTSQQTTQLNVSEGPQEDGWALGTTHYMLETDDNDDVVVEHGENHVKVYVSAGNQAYSLAEIANAEGMSVGQITGSWLADSAYGKSEDMALNEDAGMLLWRTVTPRGSETSNWLMLEKGYSYDNLGRVLERDTNGESELNPVHITSWGEGSKPEITSHFYAYNEGISNVVIQDVHFSDGIFLLNSDNVIFDGITATQEETAIMGSESITIRNSAFYDVFPDAPQQGDDWSVHQDRAQGIYMGDNDGVLLEGLFLDHNGFGYDWDPTGGTVQDGGVPPSMWSHNLYLDYNLTDVTLRDTISMRASSFGAQVRSGGFIEDNTFIDNNVGLGFDGGDYKDAGPIGAYTLSLNNLITSAGYRDAELIGGLSIGIRDGSELASVVDNIVAHLADPNNPAELDYKEVTHPAYWVTDVNEDIPYYNDTIIYNWEGTKTWADTVTEDNVEGLDRTVLDETTIQNFTAQLLGQNSATIEDLATYLRAQADGALDDVVDADLIINFFQQGFGLATDLREDAATLTFVPNDLGDGMRWDNKLNWNSGDLPGTQDGDSVDLGGNHVVFGTNAIIDTLDMGPGGDLNVYGGNLTLTGGLTGDSGSLNVEGAGQVWTEGSDASNLDIDVQGGRFANTGTMENADLTATGGQTILATGGAEYDVSSSKTLAVFEAAARVGFDGDNGGIAILDMQEGSTLAFEAQDGDLGTIEEFRSGAFGDSPNVQSGIDLGNANLSIDLAGLNADAGTAFTLMDADELVGLFDEAGVNISGLGGRDARIVVDYENDSVTLELSSGNGSVSVDTVGDQTDVTSGEEALWNALTEGQGIVSETAPMLPEDEDDPLDVAA